MFTCRYHSGVEIVVRFAYCANTLILGKPEEATIVLFAAIDDVQQRDTFSTKHVVVVVVIEQAYIRCLHN